MTGKFRETSFLRRHPYWVRALLVGCILIAWAGNYLREQWQVSEQIRQLNRLGGIPEIRSGIIVGVNFGPNSTTNRRVAPVADDKLDLLVAIRSIEWLNLADTSVGDVGLRHLQELPRLRLLYIQGTRVTAAGINDFKTAKPDCTVSWDAEPIPPP